MIESLRKANWLVSEDGKVVLPFDEISRRLRSSALPDVDLVVGIATGGVVAASLAAHQLGVPLSLMRINFRAPDNSPQRPAPQVLDAFTPPAEGSRVLLVDDVSVSGKTLDIAKGLLPGCQVSTLVLKGKGADFVLFPEVGQCVVWPWS